MNLTTEEFNALVEKLDTPKIELNEARAELARKEMLLQQEQERSETLARQLAEVREHCRLLEQQNQMLNEQNKALTMQNTGLVFQYLFSQGYLSLALEKIKQHFLFLRNCDQRKVMMNIVTFIKDTVSRPLKPEEERVLMQTIPAEEDWHQLKLNFEAESNCQIVTDHATAIDHVQDYYPHP